ncbi:MAG: translational GTPase TypA [Deltaproteobacteria bacterium]|jgi:GTP-binding protein|nr:translational GTPase TypA [Deltaproteobacteria bacterium]
MANIRNVAIIAHVDHGKTTLVDAMLWQSGLFRKNQNVRERFMDSLDLEREKGITIMAKNTSVTYEGVKINIVDTPGHADFGGEVERTLTMVEGALLLVDAAEGPLPQTRFVLQKALQRKLPIICVINKIDRLDRRPQEVLDEVYDLLIDLDADESQLDFPIFYTNAKLGTAYEDLELALNGEKTSGLSSLFQSIVDFIPPATGDPLEPAQFLVTNLEWSDYVGRLAIGPLRRGTLKAGQEVALIKKGEVLLKTPLKILYTHDGLKRVETPVATAGDIIVLAGIPDAFIGDTVADSERPEALPPVVVDEPTLTMEFASNSSPLAGKEGSFVTARHIKDRLEKEALYNVSIRVQKVSEADQDSFQVGARGELQLAVLVETMRREGFELTLGPPQIVVKNVDGIQSEPLELVVIDIPEEYIGIISEKLTARRGQIVKLTNHGQGRVRLEIHVPTRGLIGYRAQFLTDTRGTGLINSLNIGFTPLKGPIKGRSNGSLVADRQGQAVTYALYHLQPRGQIFISPGEPTYSGLIIGENSRPEDIWVNPCKEKKLTNFRASGSDEALRLTPPRRFSLEDAISYMREDELLEVTPKSIRLRKREMKK